MKKGFGSDNHSGVHPRILEAIHKANVGHAPSYGTDEWSARADKIFKNIFGEKAEAFFVFNGTAANVLSLKASTKSFQSCYCTDLSHINVDECGAPEYLAGIKLIPLPSYHGKLHLEDLKKAFIRRGDQHYSQGQVVSLTQPTELGTCYSMQELKDIIAWAKSQNVIVHIDGARLPNASVQLQKSFKEFTTDLGVDVVSFGGTKNGLMMGEAVVFLNPQLAKDFKYHRKQLAQLPSKTRFIAAQFEEFLGQNLWREIAQHACQQAEDLYQKVKNIPGVEVTQPRESNAVFAKIPSAWVKPLREEFFFYVWDEHTYECRWMTSWDTSREDIDGFATALQKLSQRN